jgi:hypothetical protein
MKMTVKELVEKVMSLRGTTIISFEAVTDARLKKTGNTIPLPCFKRSKVNGMIGYNYENSVNNQREREGSERDFEAEPRSWGVRIHPCVVEHKGNYYLTVKVERSLETPRFVDAEGCERSLVEVKPFLPSKGESRQGVDREVIHREYAVENLVNLRMGGFDIEIVKE